MALQKHRSKTIYFIIGLMIGSLYAIIMGPTTLETMQAPMTLATFNPLWFILGCATIIGLEKVKSILQ